MNSREYYENKRKNGEMFEMFCIEKLRHLGIKLTRCLKKEDQYRYGDTFEGWEFKFDMIFREPYSNRLWIEFKEKTNPNNDRYIDSGVRNGSKFYVIGDQETFWVFNTNKLLAMSNLKILKGEIIENNRKTSKGYFLKLEQADRHCEFKVEQGGQ